MGIGQKLSALLKAKGRNANELAEKLKVAPTTLYSVIKCDNSKMDIDLLIRTARHLNVPVEYFGSEPLPRKNRIPLEEQGLIKKYRQLNADDKKRVDIFIEGILALYIEEDNNAKKGGQAFLR